MEPKTQSGVLLAGSWNEAPRAPQTHDVSPAMPLVPNTLTMVSAQHSFGESFTR